MSIKHVAQVHLEQLEKVLRGDQFGMPFDAIQSLDVVMRHLPSMRYMYMSCFVHVHVGCMCGANVRLVGTCYMYIPSQ